MLGSITPHMTIVEILREHPAAEGVLSRLGIDNCCGGHATLAEHCQRLRLDPAAVVSEISDALCRGEQTGGKDQIHQRAARTRALLGQVVELSRRVASVHGPHRPELVELERVVESLVRGIAARIDESEQRLLTHARRNGADALGARVAEREAAHRALMALLQRCGELTAGFRAPAEACGSWRRLMDLLIELQTDVQETSRLEHLELAQPAA
jgi:regulator of cell morphogenesis and NO signaling